MPYARVALAAVQHARTAIDELAQLVRGTVAIGTVSAHDVDVAGLLADFHADHPNVEIALSTANSDVLVRAVRDGDLDLAIISAAPGDTPDGLDTEVVADEPIVAAVRADAELARCATVDLAELAGHPLIALPIGTGIRRQLDAAWAEAVVAPRIAFEASSPQALLDLAERGLGVAIVPQSMAHRRAGLRVMELQPQLRGRLVLAWRSSGPISPAARALLAKARSLLRLPAGA